MSKLTYPTFVALLSSAMLIGQTANPPSLTDNTLDGGIDIVRPSVDAIADYTLFDNCVVYASGKDNSKLYWRTSSGNGSVVLDGAGTVQPYINSTDVGVSMTGEYVLVVYDNNQNLPTAVPEVFYEIYKWNGTQYILDVGSTYLDDGMNPHIDVNQNDEFVIAYRGTNGTGFNAQIYVAAGDFASTSVALPTAITNNATFNGLNNPHPYGSRVFINEDKVYTVYVCADRDASGNWVNSYLNINEDDYADIYAGNTPMNPSLNIATDDYSERFTWPAIHGEYDGLGFIDQLGVVTAKLDANANSLIELYYSPISSGLTFNRMVISDPVLWDCGNIHPRIAYSGDNIAIIWGYDDCMGGTNLDETDVLYQYYSSTHPPVLQSPSTIERANLDYEGDQNVADIAAGPSHDFHLVFRDKENDRLSYKSDIAGGQFKNGGGISISKEKEDAVFYPNPAHNFLEIDPNGNELITLEITDIHGRVIHFTEFSGSDDLQRISLDGIAVGAYNIQLKYGSGKEFNERLVISE